jgi:predicted acyltransferase
MLTFNNSLHKGRILSIDAFRGITIFIMIFVNELASIKEVPQWLRHMPSDADAMTFVDVVFPAFLFIVGMSVPFSFNARLAKGDSTQMIWQHTMTRVLALLIMGLFMVNAEYGYDESKMLISMSLWGLLAYSLPILVWNKYPGSFNPIAKNVLRFGGMSLFVILYFLYVQENGNSGMTPKYWGILGLIGWAYLISTIGYWLTSGKLSGSIILLLVFVAINCAGESGISPWISYVGDHAGHSAIVMSGVVLSLLLFDRKNKADNSMWIIGFIALLFLAGYFLRPYFEVSKIRATPSWSLYSAGFCAIILYLLYALMEKRKITKWSNFFMPAANNPLLIYILPGIIIHFNRLFALQFVPDYFSIGIPGIVWSLVFSSIMLVLVKLLNRSHIQLRI